MSWHTTDARDSIHCNICASYHTNDEYNFTVQTTDKYSKWVCECSGRCNYDYLYD